MHQLKYKRLLTLFIKEVKEARNPSFVNPEEWTLCDDLQNGVSVGYTIIGESDRKLLHEIGRKYSLIPLCPNEVVGLDRTADGNTNFAVVETSFGRLKIEPVKSKTPK